MSVGLQRAADTCFQLRISVSLFSEVVRFRPIFFILNIYDVDTPVSKIAR